MDSLIYFGDTLKALDDNGKIGGYGIRFSDGRNPSRDLSGEYFTSSTYLGPRDGDGVEIIFHHGQPLRREIAALADHVFGVAKTTRDKVGIFVETVLNLRDEYEAAVFGLVQASKLAWSSGAVGHRVKKTSAGEITTWPIGEFSLTPTPAEKLNTVMPVKSLETLKFLSLFSTRKEEQMSLWESRNRYARFLKIRADLALTEAASGE